MAESTPADYRELLERLAREVGDWEDSPYYLLAEELFDLERFLLDQGAIALKEKLEKSFGTPLNRTFWTSSLAYQRLRRAREEVKRLDAEQETRRQAYLQAVREQKLAWQEWLQETKSSQRRDRLRLIPGGKRDPG
jgi:hypothetical protein